MQEYLIDIVSSIQNGYDEDKIEVKTIGSFCEDTGCYHIEYDEAGEPGMDGATTVMTIDGDRQITLVRTGELSAKMVLEKGQRHLCHYDTPFGEMMVGIFTENIRSNLNPRGGELNFRYSVDINSAFSSNNEVSIMIREAAKRV